MPVIDDSSWAVLAPGLIALIIPAWTQRVSACERGMQQSAAGQGGNYLC